MVPPLCHSLSSESPGNTSFGQSRLYLNKLSLSATGPHLLGYRISEKSSHWSWVIQCPVPPCHLTSLSTVCCHLSKRNKTLFPPSHKTVPLCTSWRGPPKKCHLASPKALPSQKDWWYLWTEVGRLLVRSAGGRDAGPSWRPERKIRACQLSSVRTLSCKQFDRNGIGYPFFSNSPPEFVWRTVSYVSLMEGEEWSNWLFHAAHLYVRKLGWKFIVKWVSEVAQSRPTLCDPVDCSIPGFSIHGILQTKILEWVTISFSRGSSQPRDRTWVSCIAGRRFNLWATRKARKFIVGEQLMVSPINCFLQGEFQRWTSCICSLVSLTLWVKVARTHLIFNISILSKRSSYCLLWVMWGFGMVKFSEDSMVAFGWKRGEKIGERVKHVLL